MTKKKDESESEISGRDMALEMNRRRWSKPGAKKRAKAAAKRRWAKDKARKTQCERMRVALLAVSDGAFVDHDDVIISKGVLAQVREALAPPDEVKETKNEP